MKIFSFTKHPGLKLPNPIVSVLIPTRARPELLQRAITSLQETAEDLGQIEILLRVDDDDQRTLEFLYAEKLKTSIEIHIVKGPRKRGYLDLHHHLWDLFEKARGEWIFTFNDDAVMTTQGWDGLLDLVVSYELPDGTKQADKIWTIIPRVKDRPNDPFEFFIVNRRVLEVLGHFSCHMGADVWLSTISAFINRTLRADIFIQHDTPRDEVYTEGRTPQLEDELHTQDLTPKVLDALKLAQYIEFAKLTGLGRIRFKAHEEPLKMVREGKGLISS